MSREKKNAAEEHAVEWYSEVPRSIKLHSLAGLALILASFGGFGYWAFAAPLAAAIIAQGSFVANGNNKIIQHLEGGIIEQMLVAEGDKVKTGDILVKLDQTPSRATERALNLKRLRLEAVVARLRAEALGRG
ncbi:MAG: biotin/lipoyl-binding protein, partial [Sphingomonadaceae bacterium]